MKRAALLACTLALAGCHLSVDFDCSPTIHHAALPVEAVEDPYEYSQTYGDPAGAVRQGWHVYRVTDAPGGRLSQLVRLRRSATP